MFVLVPAPVCTPSAPSISACIAVAVDVVSSGAPVSLPDSVGSLASLQFEPPPYLIRYIV